MTLPVIDLARTDRHAVAREVGEACERIGFFLVVGHAVDPALTDALRRAARAFFDLPLAEKRAVERRAPAFNRGYGAVAGESLGQSRGGAAPPDFKESFSIGPTAVPDSPYYRGPDAFPHFALNQWPERPAELRPLATRYFAAMEGLAARLMRLFALALALPETWFDDKIDRHCSGFRLLHYPAQAAGAAPGQLRAGEHTDYGSLTILKTEAAPGGLEVRTRAGRWIGVPSMAEAFVVNIGDLMMHWTNDRWISTLHRVANPPPGAGTGRLSLSFFHQPNYDAEIRCIPTCTGAGNPPRHAPTTSGAHRLMKLNRANSYG